MHMKSETFSLSIGLSCSLSSTTKDSMVAMLLGQEVDNTSVVVESYLPSKHDTISSQKKQQTMDVHKFVSKHSLSGLCTCSI